MAVSEKAEGAMMRIFKLVMKLILTLLLAAVTGYFVFTCKGLIG